MRIVICALNYAPELTGSGKYTGEMGAWLQEREGSVRVVCAPPYYPQWSVSIPYRPWRWQKESRNGVLVYRCPLYVPRRATGLRRLLHLASFALSSFPVMLRMALWRPHLVWAAAPTLLSAAGALLCARMSRSHAWLHVQDFEVDAAFELGILRNRRLRQAMMALERWILGRFERVSTISPRMIDRLLSKGVSQERVVLFPNWVDIGHIDPGAKGLEFRQQLKIGEHAVVCLYSGNMGEKQGLEVLVSAAAHLQERSEIVFVLCGDGMAKGGLRAQASGLTNVHFLNLQPVEKLSELLGMADIHLLPQRADVADMVMPSKLTGMLASGRPVVAGAAAGTQVAQVVEGRGLVVEPENAVAFARAIEVLAADAGLRVKLGQSARRYAEEFLSKEAVLSKFHEDLHALVR